MGWRNIFVALVTVAGAAAACSRGSGGAGRASTASGAAADTGSLDVMNAASITVPIRAELDTFARRNNLRYALQPGASLELARLITATGRRPDVLILADPAVFTKLLAPRYVTTYEIIARNRIVLAYTPKSRGGDRITAANWRQVITEPGVEVGRADPNTDPSGYRTLLAMQLSERYYHEKGLYARLLAAAPARNVRPREADQVALIETHNLDYIWTYQNLAEDNGLEYVKLPDAVDLGTPADSSTYATVSVRVLGAGPGDTLTMRGAAIEFGAAVLTTAPHPAMAQKFMAFLTSAEGRRIARAMHFDEFDSAMVVNPAPRDSAPAASSSASIEIRGLNGQSRSLTVLGLDSLPRHSIRASSHGVTGRFSGAVLGDVMRLVGAPSGAALRGSAMADYVLVEAADGYRAVFALAELDTGFTNRTVILADRQDGKPLASPVGPFRLVVPGAKRPARWVREVTRLSLHAAPL